MAKKDHAIRVAVGSADAPFAEAWRFWANRDDVYIAIRSTGGLFKLSLHADRGPPRPKPALWRADLTNDSGLRRKHPPGAMEWPPAQENEHGIAIGPVISVPRLAREYDAPPFPGLHKGADVDWISTPPEGSAVFLAAVFTRSRGVPAGFADTIGYVTEPLRLRDGRRVWVLISQRELTSDEFDRYTAFVDDLVVTTDGPIDRAYGTVIAAGSTDEGRPAITHHVLTMRNFVVAEPE